MRFVQSEVRLYLEERLYKEYTTEAFFQYTKGCVMNHSYRSIINNEVVEDDRTGDEIAMEVVQKLGLHSRRND